MSDVLSTVPASAPKNGVSRRQLVKAGVWAAPAVAVAIAMPAAAASEAPNGSVEVTSIAASTTWPWSFTVTVKNKATNVTATGSVTLTNSANSTWGAGKTSADFALAPGASTELSGFALLNPTGTTPVTVTATPTATGFEGTGRPLQLALDSGLLVTAHTTTRSGNDFTVSATVRNTSTAHPNQPVTVVFTITTSGTGAWQAQPGWTFSGNTATRTAQAYTAAGSTASAVWVRSNGQSAVNSLTATASAVGFSQTSASV